MLLKTFFLSVFLASVYAKGWKEYVDQLTKSSKRIQHAAIIGTDGGLYAKSNGFRASSDELVAMAEQFEDYKSIPLQGVQLGTVRFVVSRANQEFIYGIRDQTSMVAYKTPRTIIIALFASGDEEAIVSVRSAVLKLGQNIKTAGF